MPNSWTNLSALGVLFILALLAGCAGADDEPAVPVAAPVVEDAAAGDEGEPVGEADESDETPTEEPTTAPPTPTAPADAATPEAAQTFYDGPGDLEVPQPLPEGAPGQLIDIEELQVTTGIGYRVLYHSTSATGAGIAVSGFVRLPSGEAPDGGWPLIAWGHGTTGLGDGCAPSNDAENDQLASALAAFGYAVVATDYEGLGTPGLHPYVIGASEAHGLLDSVRAVREMDLPVTDDFVLFGHSQGGHAVIFAAQLHPTYAPELSLIGTVAGAPPSQTQELNDALIGSDFQGYLVMTAAGLAAAYDELDLGDILSDEALAELGVLESGCTGDIFRVFNPLPYDDVVKVQDPLGQPAWARRIAEQDPIDLPTTAPLLIIHGELDEQIPVETSATLLRQLCALDGQAPAKRNVYAGEDHAGPLINLTAVPDIIAWTQARFDGEPAPDDCVTPTSIDELLQRDAPLNIAHAGGDQEAPHSTLFAFGEAVAAGVDVLELDVLVTADGDLIAQHDLTVDGTTPSTGEVAALTFDEIHALDNAWWFSSQCWPCRELDASAYDYRGIRTGEVEPPEGYGPDDFAVARFGDIVERFPGLPLDIEIKGEGVQARAVADALAEAIAKYHLTESVVVVSFDDEIIDYFHELAPEVEVSPGTDRLTRWLLTREPLEDRFRVIQIPPFAQGLEVATADLIDRAHGEGLTVWVWPDDAGTQENADFYRELVARGADGIIAGRPGVLAEVLDGG